MLKKSGIVYFMVYGEYLMENIIEVQGLVKRYKNLLAVDHISFAINEGEIFGIVGPNGAGKTTTIECIEGLRQAEEGEIKIFGKPIETFGKDLYKKIGVQLQESSLPPRIKVKEALDLFASFYERSESTEKLMSELGLLDKAGTPFAKLSGGQKQRLFIALAMINHPQIIFLDELTTGLDPQARHAIWELVRQVRAGGCTVFLTTHFMEEAEILCDRVLIMDHGRIVALDTPAELIKKTDTDIRISFSMPLNMPMPQFNKNLAINRIDQIEGRISLTGRGERFISRLMTFFEDKKIPYRDLLIEQPNLESVFLKLTGKEMRE
jgi:ABC-2 type transport system ATP-binding protein